MYFVLCHYIVLNDIMHHILYKHYDIYHYLCHVPVGSRKNVNKVASVKCGSILSTATSNINTGTDHSRCTPKIVSYADAVRTG